MATTVSLPGAKSAAKVKVASRRAKSDLALADVDTGVWTSPDDLSGDVDEALADLLGKPTSRRAKASATLAEARAKMSLALSLLDEGAEDGLDTAVEAVEVKASKARAKKSDETATVKAEPVMRPNGALYHPRVLADRTDVQAMRDLRSQGVNVLLYGAPGCGKTALLEAAYGADLITFAGHGDAVVEELVGAWRPKDGGGYEWADGPLVTAMEEGKVLFVDDATLTPSTVLARLYPAMDGRGEIVVREQDPNRVVHAKPGFAVVGAHNPGVPGAILSEALASRFNLTVEVGTDYQLAIELGVEARVVRASAHLDSLRRADQVAWAPQLRELLAYKRIADILGPQAAIGNLLSYAPYDERELLSARLTWVTDPAPLTLGARA